jgi:hypothetical protein
MDAFEESWANCRAKLELVTTMEDVCLLATMVGHSFSSLKHASLDPKITFAHVEAFSMINRHSPTKISMSLIVG